MSGAYYNEHDPFAAEWPRRLILYALPVVTTLLYREQGVVVTGAFLS